MSPATPAESVADWHGGWVLDDPAGVRLGRWRILLPRKCASADADREAIAELEKQAPALWAWEVERGGEIYDVGWRLDEPLFRWGVRQDELRSKYEMGLWPVSPGSPEPGPHTPSPRIEGAMLRALEDAGRLQPFVRSMLNVSVPEIRRWGIRLARHLD